MRPQKLLNRIRAGNHDNVRFSDLQALMAACGYELDRVAGSHHIYVHRKLPSRLNLQEVRAQAKALPGSPVARRARPLRSVRGGGPLSDYHINAFYSDEDGGYIADIPDLHACSAFGDTPQEALAEVLRAKEAWLASARERGEAIPRPLYRPSVRT